MKEFLISGLYITRGTKPVYFQSVLNKNPVRFYMVLAPAHTSHETRLAARPGDCIIGSGMLDIKEILTACTETGIEFISIEQDSRNPFDDIALSLGYVKSLAGMVD